MHTDTVKISASANRTLSFYGGKRENGMGHNSLLNTHILTKPPSFPPKPGPYHDIGHFCHFLDGERAIKVFFYDSSEISALG